MRFSRKHAIGLLVILWFIVIYAMYNVLFGLGPLDPEKVPGFPRFEDAHDPLEHGYKIFFFSMEAAAITYLAFAVVLIGSLLYLKTKNLKWDTLASSSARVGIVFTTILLVNGAIFSNLAWGAYWNWDPRQTTSLFLWFILSAYLSLRTALDNVETRARLSAVLGIFGFVGVPLTHVSATIWNSLHPQLYGKTPFSLDREGLFLFMLMMLAFLVLYAYLLWLTYKLEKLNQSYQNLLSGEL